MGGEITQNQAIICMSSAASLLTLRFGMLTRYTRIKIRDYTL